MSEEIAGDRDQRMTDAVAEIVTARGPIDQTKGMLMLIYGIGEVEAFEVLRAQSRRTHTNMHALAQQFRDDIAALDPSEAIPTRAVLDGLLLSAHERVGDSTA